MPVYQGWIKLHRRLLNSRVFHNEGLLKVFIWCLLKSNHKENWVPFKTGKGDIEVHLKAGEFIFGRNSAAEFLKMNPSTVWKRVKKLESMGILNIQSNKQYSIISIVNWERYQSKNFESNNQCIKQGTSKEQARNTDKNDKNVKELNKKIPSLVGRNKKNISQNNGFSKKIDDYSERIISVCEKITKICTKENDKFNPYKFVQYHLSKNGHPKAIFESLEGLKKLWPDIQEPWAYGCKILLTKSQNYYEHDHIQESKKLKKIWGSDPKIKKLISRIGYDVGSI